ncbi:MAG: hypothetical protein JWQ83_2188 [Lacunisphaera sp.]|nr:hypothetical protein [Lacunisphaera sp.]
MKTAFTLVLRSLPVAGLLAAAMLSAQVDPKTKEQDVAPGRVVSAAPAANSMDAAPAPMHPDAYAINAGDASGTTAMSSLNRFTKAYADAGSPRVAILYNQTFANQIQSWTMESKNVFQEFSGANIEAQGSRVSAVDSTNGGAIAATNSASSVTGAAVTRSETYNEYHGSSNRRGFGSEYAQWTFEEGFSKPFLAAGVKIVDSSLVMQTTGRNEGAASDKQHVSDVNLNVDALKAHADWLIEVLMVPDGRAATGYLFRATAKRLSDGQILASSMSSLDDFKRSREKTKVVAAEGGYKFVADDSGRPTLDEYAQSIAIKLLADLTPKLAAVSAKP